MDLGLTGRTALVTGASKGIGLSIAKWFAKEGVNVCMVARSGDILAKEAEAIRKSAQVNVQMLAADMSDPAAREKVFATFPDVDIVVNNAGAVPGGSIDQVDEAAWRKGWDLKLFGYIGMTRLYIARMKEKKSGVILNIIGAGGEKLTYSYIAGSAGNASLMAFTRAMGGTTPSFGVRVLGINPGPVETERSEYLARQRAKPRATKANGATATPKCRSDGPHPLTRSPRRRCFCARTCRPTRPAPSSPSTAV